MIRDSLNVMAVMSLLQYEIESDLLHRLKKIENKIKFFSYVHQKAINDCAFSKEDKEELLSTDKSNE